MFLFTPLRVIHAAIIITSALAAPSKVEQLNARDQPEASPSITACTSPEFTGTCLNISVVSDACIDFASISTFTPLDQDLSSIMIQPLGMICTLFSQRFCATSAAANSQDEIGLMSGDYPTLTSAIGIAGAQNFDNRARSLSCSPV
ncbi:hypothetical protein K435DRAFT_972656 [Dendrothele bispora CBS 962.96]|uniref:Hydrophobin n=1 Tax=Dendrothele bispora (strain CBS 962.96) TaxID=1314807 RepID=A0A4S8KXI3_DENBC|nr:hypothetical protein K435DRAFT_972656 [Dendrothele bispora CBS 962.96]